MARRSGQNDPRADREAEARIQRALRRRATVLDLSGLGLTTLPDALGELTSLQSLHLSNNQLTALPDALGQLSSLQSLYLSHNQLTALPNALAKLASLRYLDIGGNQLTAMPDSLARLPSLQHLSLVGNLLAALPDSLGQFSSLLALYLGSNQLAVLPDSLGKLTSLRSLDLEHNQLTALPEALAKLTALEQLFLHGNPGLGIPEDVLGPRMEDVVGKQASPARPKDILSYYFHTRKASRPINEAKLILVGRGGVGKTSLVRRLVKNEFSKDQPQTKGIAITNWSLVLRDEDKVRLNIWDFGGQEVMHATHQLFLTQRSLYLVVVSGREGNEDADADNWLKLIESLGAGSPAIVVLNKIKEFPFDLNRNALLRKYPFIREFVETDCETGEGRNKLLASLRRETERLEHLRDPFPASWFAIKDRLSGMKEPYLSYREYQDICSSLGERDPSLQQSLAGNLHHLGIALNYQDDPRLSSTHVLNPHWVTNGIYLIVNSDVLKAQKGELHLSQVVGILPQPQYPQDMQAYILDLMKHFLLCFSFPDSADHYLVPELLDKQEPSGAAEFKPEESLSFRYDYTVLPQGLLPRFIVKTHTLSAGLPRWHTGVILSFDGCRALVKADLADKKVHILVSGHKDARRRLLAVIRSNFEDVHGSLKGLEPQAMVPLPSHPETASPYEDLIALEKAGIKEFPKVVGGKVMRVNVGDMLNGVDLEGARSRERTSDMTRGAVRLFYSYSHKDETLRDELETHLKLMQRQGFLETWHDRRITPGNDFKGQIDSNLEQADIILLLISADFIASDYCYDIEMKRALERDKAGEAKVIPVIVRDVSWHKAPFAHLLALPKDGEAVNLWPDKDTAWRDVSEGIERVVKALRMK